ncbi:MAG: glutamate formimidoyltransferase [Longimicrobiales bacterium]
MLKVIECVPNFSEGRDLTLVRSLVEAIAGAGAEVLDWSADPDHHRSVVTFIGDQATVEASALAAARFAVEHIDLRRHSGVHPRVGALDVLPFVPLDGARMEDAVASAHRVGRELAALGVPVFYYGMASTPPGRRLADLRKGGFEGMRHGFPAGMAADEPPDARAPHPTAGVTCVGARNVLLAWNVYVTGLDLGDARAIAAKIRERGGGFAGLRALGLQLPSQNRVQISMNLEDPNRTLPLDVFEAIEREAAQRGGRVVETEIIGMAPDTLVYPAAVNRLLLPDLGPARVLSRQVAQFVREHTGGRTVIPDSAE